MASLPSPASWRRSSQAEQTSSSSSPAQGASSESSTASNDQEYVHLNNPQPTVSSTEPATSESLQQTLAPPTQEPKQCWICQLDSTEDYTLDEPPPVWRKPCPCSLEAHNECLLQWVAAEEQPKKGALSTTKKISCPQCGTEIKIRRPRDLIVSTTELVTRASRTLVLPTLLGSVLGTTYSGLWLYGWSSMNLVFGVEETQSIFGYMLNETGMRSLDWWAKPLSVLNPLYLHRWSTGPINGAPWLLWLGLPSVAPTLILLRTKIPDQFFSVVLPIYFISPYNRQITWPPRAGLAFALIPYLKAAYSSLYNSAFSELEKKWELAVQRQPREGETAEQIAAEVAGEEPLNDANEDGEAVAEQDNVLFGIQIEVDVPAGIVDEVGEPAPANAEPGHNHAREHNRQWAIEGDVFSSNVASTVMGALLFPAISSAMGNLLKHTLPLSWTLSERVTGTRGLLREKWGRSLVGGCLLVVLKDMVMLYCKWKKARDFGKREILDWVKPKEKRRGEGGDGESLWNGFLARGR